MQTLRSLTSHLNKCSLNPPNPSLFLLSSSLTSISCPNPLMVNYFIKTLGFSKSRALAVSNRFSHIKSPDKPPSVIQFFQNLGFSDSQIRSSVRISPQILFSDVDKTLKPKIQFFQEIGLVGFDLGQFISNNSTVLTVSLEKKLVPCIEIIKKVLLHDDENNDDLIRVLKRSSWVVSRDPKLVLLPNIAYLESCGIVGSQLALLLRRQPRLFVTRESKLKDLVSRVLEMGFSVKSRMLVHALYSVSCLSEKTFKRKLELFTSYGFSENEIMEMFRRAPGLLRTSEEKLKLGIEFFMNTVEFKKDVLVNRPTCLMNSLKQRIIPRYRVLQVLKLKGLLKKDLSFIEVLNYTEEDFMEKLISRFRDDAKELLVAYKAHLLDSSSSGEEES